MVAIAASGCGQPRRVAATGAPVVAPNPGAPPRSDPPAPGDAPPGDAPSPRASSPVPSVELVTADNVDEDGHTPVRIAKTTPTGLVVVRTASAPGAISALAWIGPDPVVMLDSGEVGRVTARGYEAFKKVPIARWTIPKPHVATGPDEPTGKFDTPRWRMIVDAAGAVWQARCDWGWDLGQGVAHHCVPEGGRCDAWVFARVWPGPLELARTQPAAAFDSAAPPSIAAPAIAPPSSIHAELVQVGPDARQVLRCTEAGKTTQYPTDDDRDERQSNGDGVDELTWLSATPPMLAVSRRVGCLDTEWVVFEGCQLSDRYSGAQFVAGPHDLLAILGSDGLSVLWQGHMIGTLDGVARFAFAPER